MTRPKSAATPAKPKHQSDLDKALENTFPASDPVAIGTDDKGAGARRDRKTPVLDRALVDELARKVKDKH